MMNVELLKLRDEVERRIFALPGWMSCVITWARPCNDGHRKSVLRPVELQGKPMYQDTRTGGPSAAVANYSRAGAKELVRAMLESDFSEVHVQSADGDFHGRVTKRGRVLSSRSRRLQRDAGGPAAHDRAKDYPLEKCGSPLLLQALGFAGPDGKLLPSMHAKYRQVNEFLRAIEAVLEESGVRSPESGVRSPESEVRSPKSEVQSPRSEVPSSTNSELRTLNSELRSVAPRAPLRSVAPRAPLRIVDAGCGRAYLSFAARAYVAQALGIKVELTGVDIRPDIVATCRATAERLDLAPPAADFVAADIAAFRPAAAPDLVMSLHACDTATDIAIARGVEWGARAIVSVPCCQHEIQKTLRADGASRALLRHGILRERLADLLADALRAALLRVVGYRVRVVEFVEPEATGRNVMLRAVRGVRPGAGDAVDEYLALRDEWKVRPPLEELLAPRLAEYGIHPA